MEVTFWSSCCAEGCLAYEQLLAREKELDGSCSTTLTLASQDDIDNIMEVAVMETFSEFFYHIHEDQDHD